MKSSAGRSELSELNLLLQACFQEKCDVSLVC